MSLFSRVDAWGERGKAHVNGGTEEADRQAVEGESLFCRRGRGRLYPTIDRRKRDESNWWRGRSFSVGFAHVFFFSFGVLSLGVIRALEIRTVHFARV